MDVRRTLLSLVIKRSNYSSSLNVLSNDINVPLINKEVSKNNAKPYADIPGPKELPIIGNSWRFAPYIGKLVIISYS